MGMDFIMADEQDSINLEKHHDTPLQMASPVKSNWWVSSMYDPFERQLSWTKSQESDIAFHFKTLEQNDEGEVHFAKEKETALFALQKDMEAKMMIIEQLETKLSEVQEQRDEYKITLEVIQT
jgi:hypothetical protein